MVRVHAGAAAYIAGVLRFLQERPDVARTCRRSNASQLVVPLQVPGPAEHVELEGSHLESRAGAAGSSLDVGAPDEGSPE